MFFNNASLPLWAIAASGTAVIVLGVFTYTFYNNIFIDVHKIYKNLIIKSLIVVTVVVILGVFIYTFYNNINIKAFFPTIYCSISETVSPEIRVQLLTLVHLQYLVGDLNSYDITESRVFFEMLCRRSGELGFASVNGVYINIIKVNYIVYSVDPNIIHSWFDLCG